METLGGTKKMEELICVEIGIVIKYPLMLESTELCEISNVFFFQFCNEHLLCCQLF